MAAVGSMLAEDQDVSKALICSPADFAARHGEVAVEGGSWMGPPPLLAGMLDLPTSSMTDGTALAGDFALGAVVAMRTDLRLEVVRWKQAASASHLLVAYMRAGVYAIQPGALYIQKTTVL